MYSCSYNEGNILPKESYYANASASIIDSIKSCQLIAMMEIDCKSMKAKLGNASSLRKVRITG
jgi:hypothetical protein